MKASEFGAYLRSLRRERNLTIRELESHSGVSNGYLSQMETGKRGIPSPEILKKIAKPLAVAYDDLMIAAGYLDSSQNFSDTKTGKFQKEQANEDNVSPEEQDFLTWVERELEGAFFYDFAGSPEEMKQEMMDDLRVIWKLRKGKNEDKANK